MAPRDPATDDVSSENLDKDSTAKLEPEQEQEHAHTKHTTTKSFGIRRVELLNKSYESALWRTVFFVTVFIVAYVYSLDGTIRYTFQTYATNSYAEHSLLSTINVIKAVIAAAAQPTYARLSDRFGRLELTIISIIFYSMGTVIQSQAYDVYRFAGGSVMYQIGYSGIIIMLQIAIADFSNLNWRLTCSMIPATPFIINTWVSGNVASDLLAAHSWNYCIGIWAFIFPLTCIPYLACLFHMLYKARQTPEWKELMEEENEKFLQIHTSRWSVKYITTLFKDLFWELDLVGILFIICVFGFILVPLTIAGGTTDTWKKASTIVPLVIGVVLAPFFVYWEAKFARFPIMPLPLLRDRGVWSALVIGLLIDFIWYMPNDYMYTVLLVGMRASIKAATRITSLYSFVSVIAGPLLGLVVVRFRRVKPFIIVGTGCWAISLGLLMYYRGGNDGIESQKYLNGVIGSLCLMGFGAGFFTYPTQVSISTCTDHEYMAVIIALYLASYNVGAAIGSAVSGAIWTNKMYPTILKKFTEAGLDTTIAATAYSAPLTFIVTYVWGTPERIAVVLAYAEVQRYLCITGLVLCFPLIICSLFLRDHKLESVQSLGLEGGDSQSDDKGVVVNNHDSDYVFQKISSLFRRGNKGE